MVNVCSRNSFTSTQWGSHPLPIGGATGCFNTYHTSMLLYNNISHMHQYYKTKAISFEPQKLDDNQIKCDIWNAQLKMTARTERWTK